MTTAAELKAGTLIGAFRIDHLVGRGGMGVVYRATQLTLERVVALKLIAPGQSEDAQFRERFQREWRIAASLDHPNMLPIYEAGEAEGLLFLAMRYVAGQDLGALVENEGRLAPARATAIIVQVASALDAAHARGLVHRDVKPTNILLEQSAGGEHAYLADFGLARNSSAESGLSRIGDLVGTVNYVAPEQVRGETVDERTDVYGLGCVLYEALTGQVPYPRENELARLWAHMHDPPPAVTAAQADVPEGMDEVIARSLAKRREDRYGSAGDLGRAAVTTLQKDGVERSNQINAQGEETVSVPDQSRGRLAPRLSTRTILSVAGAFVLLAGAVFSLVWALSGAGAEAEPPSRTESVGAPSVPGEVVGEPIRIRGVGTLASGEGGVWTAGEFGARLIDPGLNEAIGLPIRFKHDPFASWSFAVGEGALWFATENTVSRIDPRTRAADEPITFAPRDWSGKVAAGEGGVWIGANSLWYSLQCDHDPPPNCPDHAPSEPKVVVSRVDPESNLLTPVGSIVLPHRRRFGAEALDLVIGEDAVWILIGDGTLRRIDPRTSIIGEPIRLGLGDDDEPRAMAVGNETVWVLTSLSMLVRVDVHSRQVVGSPTLVPGGSGYYLGQGIAFGEGSIWVTDMDRNTVARIDPASQKVVGVPIEVPASPIDVAVADGAIWVASELDGVVTRIDPTP